MLYPRTEEHTIRVVNHLGDTADVGTDDGSAYTERLNDGEGIILVPFGWHDGESRPGRQLQNLMVGKTSIELNLVGCISGAQFFQEFTVAGNPEPESQIVNRFAEGADSFLLGESSAVEKIVLAGLRIDGRQFGDVAEIVNHGELGVGNPGLVHHVAHKLRRTEEDVGNAFHIAEVPLLEFQIA